MSLNHHQQRQLYRIESRLLSSDPHLAAMLAVFGRLAGDQRLPAWEQVATRVDRIRQAAALIAKAVTVMVAAAGLLVGAVLALATALVIGRRARPAQPTRQQTGPEATAGPGPA
jgi:hypothetical protein